MKIKSLTYLLATVLLSACAKESSATFSYSSSVSSISSASSSSISSLTSHEISQNESTFSSSIISSQEEISTSEISSQESTIETSQESSIESSDSETLSSSLSSQESLSSETSSEHFTSSVISESESSAFTSEESSSIESSISSEESSSASSSETIIPHSYYKGYYGSLTTWENGEDLKNQLYTIIRNGYTPISYNASSTSNYASNIDADRSIDDFEYLDVVYSATNVFKSESNRGWQREHAFCASLMCGSGTGDAVKYKGRATDFHNLFAADASANGSRGNKNYGKADTKASNYTNNTVNNGEDGYSYSANFEPANKDKGRLARAIFYMATMYKDDEFDDKNNITMKGLTIQEDPVDYVAGNNCHFAHGNLSELLKWNRLYDVDFLEMQHNISVFTNTNNPDGVAQGNRNPFVDYPELVDYIFGSKKDQPGSLNKLVPSAYFLNMEEKTVSHYALKEARRDMGYGETITTNDYKVVAVYTDCSYEEVTNGITHSFSDKTFSEEDGEMVTATIETPINTISYAISLNPMGACSHQATLSSSGIDPLKHHTGLNVTYGDIPFTVSYTTSIQDDASFYVRNISAGGVTLGSGNSPLTTFTIQTQETYTIDRAYIKAVAGNTSSYYLLDVFVGETLIASKQPVNYLKNGYLCLGAKADQPLTGQVRFVFTGSSSLKINSIAFNTIIA